MTEKLLNAVVTMPDTSNVKVGERLRLPSVPAPYNAFLYEIISVGLDQIKLRVAVDREGNPCG